MPFGGVAPRGADGGMSGNPTHRGRMNERATMPTERWSATPVDKITFPPVVYVPCAPLDQDDEGLSVDLRRTREGKLALLVYSALDRLIICCGEQQPWVVLPTANLEKIRENTDFELILLDIEIPDDFRRHGAEVSS